MIWTCFDGESRCAGQIRAMPVFTPIVDVDTAVHVGGTMQNDVSFDQADEDIFIGEVSDEALERAAGGKWQQKPDASPTFWSLVVATCCVW